MLAPPHVLSMVPYPRCQQPATKRDRLLREPHHMREKFGKHTILLRSSFLAHRFQQHLGDRGDEPRRRRLLLKGETKRKRLGIPMFMGEVK
jgi:hypothetical protein